MKDQRETNLGIIQVSYIFGIIAFLSMFLFTVLSITFSILSLILSFIAIGFNARRVIIWMIKLLDLLQGRRLQSL
ncbi:hypothetical protein J45TS6_47890 [Paenibacillus sp. J45TS6]|nr:hypothetical protein J45TS6_47890 [Paenibacillus sp. J45TS6]